MTLFDVATLAVLLISALLAFARGFTNEVLSILSLLLAVLASLKLFNHVSPLIRGFVSPEWLAATVAAAAIFIVVFLVASLVCHQLAKKVHKVHPKAGLLDKSLGFAFGLVRGLVIVALCYLAYDFVIPQQGNQAAWIRQARFLPVVESTASALFGLVPFDAAPHLGDSPPPIRDTQSTVSDDSATKPIEQPSTLPDLEPAPGYNQSQRQELDRLFDMQSTEGQN